MQRREEDADIQRNNDGDDSDGERREKSEVESQGGRTKEHHP